MTDSRTPAPGWYPDPQNPGQQRWWDGFRWADDARVAPSAASSYPDAPAYPSAPAYSSGAQPPRDVETNTVWIWLVVLLPVLQLLSYFLIDWRGYFESVFATAANPGAAGAMATAPFSGSILAVTLLGWVILAATIVAAWLDWRELRRRGIQRPFHWAWIFFALIVTNGIYVIGRGVMLRRETGKGLTPIWVWIAVTVLSWIVAGIYAGAIISYVLETVSQYPGLTSP